MRQEPKVGVGVVIINSQDEVLLIRRGRAPAKGQWSIPGGKQKWGETIHEAAIREISEETNLILQQEDLVFVGIVDLISLPDHHYTIIDFACRKFENTPCAGDDALECQWFSLSALTSLSLSLEMQNMIKKAFYLA